MTVINTNPGLRKILFLCYVPAMAFCIASAATARWYLPALGMLPLHFSIVTAAAILAWERKKNTSAASGEHRDEEENSRLLGPSMRRMSPKSSSMPVSLFILDFLIATGHFLVLLGTYLTLGVRNYRGGPVSTLLKTYATVPLWVCFFVHAWCAITIVPNIWRNLPSRKSGPSYTCPNCNTPAVRAPQGYTLAPQNDEPEVAQAPFRDASFDGDAAIRPDEAETGSNNSRDSKES